MSTIITETIDVDLTCYIDECVEAVREANYLVFETSEEAYDYVKELEDLTLDKIKEIVAEARNKVIYEQVSQDYKELYDKLDRVLFYE